MKKRILSMVMVLVMLISMLPVEVIALTAEGVYENGDTIWLVEGQLPDLPVTEGHQWTLTGETKQETQYVCGLAGHTHVNGCAVDEAGEFACGGHVHGDGCTTRVYEGCTAHAHSESCTKYACGLTASSGHLHGSACKQLTCTTAEGTGAHAHSESCAPTVSYTCTPAEGEEHTHSAACESVSYGCGLAASAGHVHGGSCYQLICTIPEGQGAHAHTESCGAASVVCGLELHAHSDACVFTTKYTCGEEGHTHVTGCTLTCQAVEENHVHTGSCFSCGMIAHAHGEACGIVTVFAQWAVTEVGAEAPKAAEESLASETTEAAASETTGEADSEHSEEAVPETTAETVSEPVAEVVDDTAAAATTYTITLRAGYTSQQGSLSYQRSMPIKVYSLDGETRTEVGTYTTGSSRYNPTAAASLPAGAYVAVVEYTSGSYTYLGEEYFTVTDADSSVTVTLERLGSAANAEERYNDLVENNGYFDHVDIRVNGNYVLVDGTGSAQSARISDVYLTVVTNGNTVINNRAISASNTNETYEWRTTGLRLDPENTQVIVTFDLTVGDKVYDDVSITYSSKADFVRAIQNCDIQQGLDFVVSVTEIKEVIEYYTVTYQWRVRNEDGSLGHLPAGAPNPPASSAGHAAGEQYAYDTEYVNGTSFIDTTNGLMYTFHGWETYSHSSEFSVTPSETVFAISGSTIEITDDTWINGIWTVTQLPPASAYITLKKVFEGDYPAEAEKLWFRIDAGYDADGDGVSSVDVEYAMLGTGTYQIPVYQYDTPFVITEHHADVPGYTRTTTASAAGDHVASSAFANDTITVGLNKVYEGENVLLGGVTFTNTYTKNLGEDLHILPYLSVLKSTDAGENLAGATFTLTASDGTVYTGTSEADGYIHFTDGSGNRLTEFPAGTYTLQETAAPSGYELDTAVYTVTVAQDGEAVEELRYNGEKGIYEFVKVYYYTLTVSVPSGSDAVFNTSGGLYRLHVYNTPVTGSLSISKGFEFYDTTGTAAQTVTVPTSVYMEVAVTGTDEANSDYSQTILVAYNEATRAWEGSLTGIPVGSYKIQETFASIHGYNWQEGKVKLLIDGKEGDTFTVSPDGTVDSDFSLAITNVYHQWEYVDFYVQKYETGTSTALQGAVFTLYSDSGMTAVVSSQTTDAHGRAHFQNLGDGIYYLKETKAPAGYEPIDTVWEVKVTATTDANGITTHDITVETKSSLVASVISFFTGGIDSQNLDESDVLVVYNNPVTGSLTINKVLGDGNDLTEEHNILVSVQGPNGYSYHGELTVNGDKKAAELVLSDLRLGEYTIVEYGADKDGYTLTTSYTVGPTTSTDGAHVTLTEENAAAGVEVTVTNVYDKIEHLTETTASFTVKKVDQNGKALSGAAFTLTGPNGYNRTYVTNAQGVVLFSDLKGIIDANGAPQNAQYKLTETQAPAGYAKLDTQWTVTVVEDDGKLRIIEPTENKNFFENIWDWIVGDVSGGSWDGSSATFTVVNEELADLTITKSFVDAEGKAITDIPADLTVSVTVTGPNNYSKSVTLNAAGNWSAVIEDLEKGTYTVAEAAASLHGYTWNGVTYSNEDDTAAANNTAELILGTENIALALTNHYTEWEETEFQVLKTNETGTSFLPGAVFTLYADSARTQVVGTQTTGADGKVTFGGFTVAQGQTVTYYLEETTAPDNYAKDDTLWTVTISHDENGYDVTIQGDYNTANNVLTVKNTEILGSLTVTKLFGADSDYTPEEIKVDITGNDYANTVTLNAENHWTQIVTGLKMGTYTIQEQDATAEGYDLKVTYNGTEAVNANVTLDEAAGASTTAAVIIENTYTIRETTLENPVAFQVLKVNQEGQKLSGATFTLYEADGTTVVDTKTTGTDGKATFDNLKGAFDADGKPVTVRYILKETDAPVGYEETDATWTILVTEDDGQVTIELNKTDNVFENIWNWIIGKDSTGDWDDDKLVLTVTNTRRTGNLTVAKEVDIDGLDETDAAAQALMTETYTFTLAVDGDLVETIQVKGGETGTFAYDIPYGSTYAVDEVTRNGNFTVAMTENSTGIMDTETELDNGITVTVINTYTFRDESGLELEFLKISSGSKKALKGATFTLYSDKACKNAVAKYTTGSDGIIVIDDITEPGTFYLKETKAPSGYVKLTKAIEIVAYYEYTVSRNADGDPIIVRTLLADVTGKTANNDGQYVITNTPATDNPKTGDAFNITLWIGTLFASAAAAVVLLVLGKKRRV